MLLWNYGKLILGILAKGPIPNEFPTIPQQKRGKILKDFPTLLSQRGGIKNNLNEYLLN
jgi:hypothetical protein